MEVETFKIDSVTVVALKGDLDLGAAGEVKRALGELVEDDRCRLVIDMEGVTGVDSAGLGAIVWGMKVARAEGGDLRLCSLSENVHTILNMTRLNASLMVYSDRPQAISSWD